MELNKENFDAIIIGSGIGGLVTASQLVAKGAQVLVLEKYIIPGGSGGSFKRKGYTFDVGASICLLYTSPSPRDRSISRMPSSA